MKNSFLFIVLLATSVVSTLTPSTRFEAGLHRLLEKCKAGDRARLQSLPIAVPSLNPLILPAVTINRDYTLTLSELTVTGVENMSVKKLTTSLNDLSISVEIFIPSLAVKADRYKLQALRVLFIPLVNSAGEFRCHINNLVGRGTVKFGKSGSDTVITSLKVDYTVQNVQVQLGGSSALVNRGANKKIWNLINNKELATKIEGFIKERSSRYLRGHTPQQFIQIISSLNTCYVFTRNQDCQPSIKI